MSVVHSVTPNRAVFNLLRRLHFYIGLFVAPFILMAALSGTLYVLAPQLENFIYADALTVEPHGTARPLSSQKWRIPVPCYLNIIVVNFYLI